jgi:hypothetical protein
MFIMEYKVYSFSYNNPERKAAMERRFATVGVPLHWVRAIGADDPSLHGDDAPRVTAIMHGHLEMIRIFLEDTDAKYGIFCEDDIFIRKDFKQSIDRAIELYEMQNLDILLLGYLLNYVPYHTPRLGFQALEYGTNLWGAQMYMMDKRAAQAVYDAFCDRSRVSGPYSSDWTITKFGKRAMIYPMIAVETGAVCTSHVGQVNFHRACYELNFDPEIHI